MNWTTPMLNSEVGMLTSRRGRRSAEVAPPAPVAIDPVMASGLRDFVHHYREDGELIRSYPWRAASLRPALGRTMLRAVYEMSATDGPIGSKSTAHSYYFACAVLFNWLEKSDPERRVGCHVPLNTEHLEAWKAWLDGQVETEALKSKVAYAYKGNVLRVLKHVWLSRPEDLGGKWGEASFLNDPFRWDATAREPYSANEARRILETVASCLRGVVTDSISLKKRPKLQVLETLIYVGLSLRLGIETECLDRLRPCDIKPNADGSRIRIRYTKRRAPSKPGRTRNAVAPKLEELTEQIGGFDSAGGLLALLMKTARERGAGEADCVWQLRLRSHHFVSLAKFLNENGLRGDDGGFLPINRTRFRVTYKAGRQAKAGGNLSIVADDHSRDVAAKHYLENNRLRPQYEATIIAAAEAALADALMKPTVVSEADPKEQEAELRVRGEPKEVVEALSTGATDVWLASCRGFSNSPFAAPGTPCPKAFWGCLSCSNALITRRTLPRILRFLSHLCSQRAVTASADWETKFGTSYRQITEDILPEFPAEAIAEARAVAEGIDGDIHLPPELIA